MDERISQWLERGEQLFHDAQTRCEALDREITQLTKDLEEHRQEMTALAKILSSSRAESARMPAPTPPPRIPSALLASAFLPTAAR